MRAALHGSPPRRRPRAGPGHHRVPAHQLDRPPPHHPRAVRLAGPRRGVRRDHPAGDGGGGAGLLPARHRPAPPRLGGGDPAARPARDHRVASGLVRPDRHPAGGGARVPVQARHRDQPAVALRGGRVDDRARPPARRGGVDRPPRASPRGHELEGRVDHRPLAGGRADPRLEPLRHDPHRRAVARAPARGRGPLLVPALHSRHHRRRALRAPPPPACLHALHRRRAGGGRGGGLRRRNGGHRRPAPLPPHPYHAGVRRLPAGARRPAPRAPPRREAAARRRPGSGRDTDGGASAR